MYQIQNLYWTFIAGDGTTVSLVDGIYIHCIGPSCGKNGLVPNGTYSSSIIIRELYFNGWTTNDTVVPISPYQVTSLVTSCNRVGE